METTNKLDSACETNPEIQSGDYADDDAGDNEYDEISIDSNDTLQNYISFTSHRNDTGLEESISFTYPVTPNMQPTTTLKLSTLLEEDDLAPLFDGAGWAGTRVWSAAIWGIKYLVDNYIPRIEDGKIDDSGDDNTRPATTGLSLCELGCGLGVPGMIWHLFGGRVVLTDQESIMSQLRENIKVNFPFTMVPDVDKDFKTSTNKEIGNNVGLGMAGEDLSAKIEAQTLEWSRESLRSLLNKTGYTQGFDIVLNCDCVYEPLYGKSWEYLAEVIDECLKVNPKCLVVTSVERRSADGIDLFLDKMRRCQHVNSVEKILEAKEKNLELYLTRGRI